MHKEQPFYGFEILKEREHATIEAVLQKYKGKKADDALKKEIYDELQILKEKGVITIPFRVILRKDLKRALKNYVEIILDTKL